MSNELSVETMCVCTSDGHQIWITPQQLEAIESVGKSVWLVNVNGQRVNPSHITGIYTSEQMDEVSRRKNGQYKCKEGNWHDYKEKCACEPAEKKAGWEVYRQKHYEEKGYYPIK